MFIWAFSSARLQAPAAITVIEKICLLGLFLLPNSNSMGLDQEELAFVAACPWMRCEIIHEPSNYCWNHLGVISDLQGDDPFVLRWWIRRDVGKVAVQRNQNSIQLLRLRDDNSIIGILWNMFL
jgi:hypothetical protein